MSVSKIFKTLIIVVACVLVGAMVLNVLLPNATASIINTVEGQIFNATGMNMDFNGDGRGGRQNTNTSTNVVQNGGGTINANGQTEDSSNEVTGFN